MNYKLIKQQTKGMVAANSSDKRWLVGNFCKLEQDRNTIIIYDNCSMVFEDLVP
jgi:hypothetical protein